MGNQFVENVWLTTETCCNCGMLFAMTTEFRAARLKDREIFHCPAGHKQHFTGASEEAKLKKELERKAEMLAAAEARTRSAQIERDQVTRAHMRMRTRVMNGVCPCCNRTFQNLMRHMRTEHQGEFSLRTVRMAYGMTQGALAKEIGIAPGYISAEEREKSVPVHAKREIDAWLTRQGEAK